MKTSGKLVVGASVPLCLLRVQGLNQQPHKFGLQVSKLSPVPNCIAFGRAEKLIFLWRKPISKKIDGTITKMMSV